MTEPKYGEWQDIGTAPQGPWILTYCADAPSWQTGRVNISAQDKHGRWFDIQDVDGAFKTNKPTHWMPLPPEPKQ